MFPNLRWIGLLIAAGLLSACNLDVEVTPGGTVVDEFSVLDCRADSGVCFVENYEDLDFQVENLITTFRAIPDTGYVLSHWEGDCSETISNKCRVRLEGDVYLRAVFEPIDYAEGEGEVDKEVRFVAIGDTGKGNDGQYRVSQGIETVCAEHGCDFVLGMGDNFYDGTPQSAYDPIFEEKFEQPYANLDLPFYMVLGNHDTGLIEDGDGGNQRLGENQVAYHFRGDRMSDKWQMPARYYQFAYPQSGAPLVDFFALDSAPFVGLVDLNPDYAVDGYAQSEGAWLEQQLAASTADWKIAFGHHPYISNGQHGNAGEYDSTKPGGPLLNKVSGHLWRNFLENFACDSVDLYLSGHDHDLQALKPAAPCGKTNFVVSGAAASARSLERPGDNIAYFQNGDREGFVYLHIRGNALTITSYAVDENGAATMLAEKTLQRVQ